MTRGTPTSAQHEPATDHPPSALVIDANAGTRRETAVFLKQSGLIVETVANGQAAVSCMTRKSFALALVDASRGGCDGLALLAQIQDIAPQTAVVLVSASPDVKEAVAAIQGGARDYMPKPVDTAKLAAIIDHCRAERQLEPVAGSKADQGSRTDRIFVTRTPEIMQLLEAAAHVAGTRATILITGESGTGKEVLARCIHQAAGRPDRPFVAVNCAALPETLIESELFGHEKGAFTGASQRKIGKFEQVGAGTIVLDEIGDMPLALQPKILRILQERRVERLGGATSQNFEGQIIAITNQDLEEAVQKGKFREDLYYRINVVPFHLPPLRARRDDIPLLSHHFITKYEELYQKRFETVDSSVLTRMAGEAWRGNVRELENRIERAVLLSPGPHLEDTLLAGHDNGKPVLDEETVIRAGLSVRGMEKILICKTLQAVNQNRARASELLGISVRTLRNKLNEYKAAQEEPRREALT